MSGNEAGKPSRTRTMFTDDQLLQLEKAFTDSLYLTKERKVQLCKQLKLTDRQVKIWFQNRRMKLKKEQQSYDGKDEVLIHNREEDSSESESPRLVIDENSHNLL